MPIQVTRGSRVPCAVAITADQIGVVHTRAVAVATVVSFALGTHVPKWTASASPLRTQTASVRRSRPTRSPNWARPRVAAAGPSTASDNALRQKARASAGAAAYAINGAEVDTLTTATHSANTTGKPSLNTVPHRAMLRSVAMTTRLVDIDGRVRCDTRESLSATLPAAGRGFRLLRHPDQGGPPGAGARADGPSPRLRTGPVAGPHVPHVLHARQWPPGAAGRRPARAGHGPGRPPVPRHGVPGARGTRRDRRRRRAAAPGRRARAGRAARSRPPYRAGERLLVRAARAVAGVAGVPAARHADLLGAGRPVQAAPGAVPGGVRATRPGAGRLPVRRRRRQPGAHRRHRGGHDRDPAGRTRPRRPPHLPARRRVPGPVGG